MSYYAMPQEMTDHVIGFLADDRPSLLSCALTSSSFYFTSHRLIFFRIELDMHIYRCMTDTLTTSGKLNRALSHKPHYTSLIKEISIKRLFANEEQMNNFPNGPYFLLQDTNSFDILSKLTSLSKLTIVGHAHKQWTLVPPNLRTVIAATCQFPEMANIVIDSLSNFPVHLLEKCTALKHLTFGSVSTLDHSLSDRPLSNVIHDLDDLDDSLHLESLFVDYNDVFGLTRFVDWLTDPHHRIYISRLRHLTLHVKREHALMWRLLAASTNTLERLEFDIFISTRTADIHSSLITETYETIDLGQLRSLRKLFIHFRILNVNDDRSFISILANILSKFTQTSVIEEITLRFYVVRRNNPIAGDNYSSWKTLDLALSRDIPSLKRVVIQLDGIKGQYYENAKQCATAGLRDLDNRGLLHWEIKSTIK